jgi:hypothetical protein
MRNKNQIKEIKIEDLKDKVFIKKELKVEGNLCMFELVDEQRNKYVAYVKSIFQIIER